MRPIRTFFFSSRRRHTRLVSDWSSDVCSSDLDGVLWLHGYGNVFVVTLGQGEQIDIEPGGWIYKDRTVQMQTIFQKISTGVFASAGQLFWNRFTGPGRIALQSMYWHMPTE